MTDVINIGDLNGNNDILSVKTEGKKAEKKSSRKIVKKSDKKSDSPLPKSVYDIPPNCRTVTISTNWTINTDLLFHRLKITKLQKEIKKRKDLAGVTAKPGTIIGIKIKDDNGVVHKRGVSFSDGCFPNSVCIIIYIKKWLNIKIPRQGKFHITGCKDVDDIHLFVLYLWKYMKNIENRRKEWERRKKEDYYKMPTIRVDGCPTVIFNVVMNNVSFNLGFKIDRKKLYDFLYKYTDFAPIQKIGSEYSGVVCKLPVNDMSDTKLIRYRYINNEWYYSTISWEDYLCFLPDKDRKEEEKKELYHSFMTFHTGSVIQSSPSHKQMGEIYDKFVKSIFENRKEVESSYDE